MIEAFKNRLFSHNILRQRKNYSDDIQSFMAELFSENDAVKLSKQIAQIYSMSWIDLAKETYSAVNISTHLFPIFIRHQAIPLSIEQSLCVIASAHPITVQIEKELYFAGGLVTQVFIAPLPQIQALLPLYQIDNKTRHQIENNRDSIPILLDKIFRQAKLLRSSDIHIEAYQNRYRIRFRCDGVLSELTTMTGEEHQRLVAAIKLMANLDVAEKRMPQDGHIRYRNPLSNLELEARISSLPTSHGEKVVIRLVDPVDERATLSELGFSRQQEQAYTSVLQRSHGMVLITGPTGSGKTRTLYASLNHINAIERNIATVEDPIECFVSGINQVQVDMSINLTFSKVLRSLLRQDPDIIMVGEIRDKETADMAVRAAQTGHLILSTLHTKSALEAIIRLRNLGVERHNLAASLNLIINQRLVRKLCQYCKLPATDTTPYKANPKGCSKCHNGYKGRTGVFEVLFVTVDIANAIIDGASIETLKQMAKHSGGKSLGDIGREYALAGTTSEEELLRVIY
ncbi:GspE/PulE family protein [Vibrio sonorensis]|uniref:GspE/PulE family protein n=1 Tax=Vibrio sonorensis TaxID=1004316 RepID=UPI0008D9D018|nr:GspE/PulE family protein [Vibrio sonorensis]